jgi:DNA polymerase I-like protein with 3'-5' exonuclease and polymerase domains
VSLTRPVKLIATYHPAAALHRTSLLRQVYADFQSVGRALQGRDTGQPTDEWSTSEQYTVGRLNTSTVTALDTETTSTGDLWSVQVATHPGSAVFIPSNNWHYPQQDTLWVAHNATFDFGVLDWWPARFVDTMYGAYLLGLPQGLKELAWRLCGMEMKSYHDMVGPTQEAMSRTYLEQVADHTWPRPGPRRPDIGSRARKALQKGGLLRWWQADVEPDPDLVGPVEAELGPMPRADLSDLPFEDALYYSCRDADATLRVWQAMRPMLEGRDLLTALDIGCQQLPMIHAMMSQGMPADSTYFQALSEQYSVEMEEERAFTATEFTPDDFNPNSDQQVADLVFDSLRLTSRDRKGTRRTPTGRRAVDETVLKRLDHPTAGHGHEIIVHLLRYRHLLKLKTTYADPLASLSSSDGRIRGQIKTTRTETFRLAMASPNLQNIPTRTEEGRRVRMGFRAPPGRLLLSADYSQIEMRVLAHESQDPTLLQIFQEGRDVHTETASAMFGVPLSEATLSRYRAPAKTLGFGVAYGLTQHGMKDQMDSENLSWSLEDCDRFITDYYRIYRGVKRWQDHTVSHGITHGWVEDMFGRRRFTPELQCPVSKIYQAGVRQSINMPIQAGAAGILSLAMAQLWNWLLLSRQYEDGLTLPLLQVHDEIIFETSSDPTWLSKQVVPIMEDAVYLDVPVLVNTKLGGNWGELE